MRVLVSGGSSGVGAAACLRLAEAALARGEEAMVAVCGIASDVSGAEQVVRSIEQRGGSGIALVGDLSDPEVPSELVGAAVAEFGGLDGLVANAGIARPGALVDVSLDDWERMFAVNLRSGWLLAKASYPHLKESRGSACFTSSMSGQLPHADNGAYSPTKAAVTSLAQTLALEWAPDGIRVNVVSPGMTRTAMTERVYADPELKRAREAIIPLARIANPSDIANVIEFLLGPLSSYVTGQDICVDGGFTKSILSHIPGRASTNA